MSENSPQPAAPIVLAQLTAESDAWQALLNVLTQEEQALIDGEADLLPRLSASKMAQLRTLSNMARARHHDLLAAGLTPDPAGMDAWLAQQAKPEQRALWSTLQTMEERARAMNQRIGALIELRLNSTRQALNVLVQAAKGQGGMYDQAGCSVASRQGKPLTAA
jgi:flagella synthesis protein FlgN